MSRPGQAWLGMAPGVRLLSVGLVLLGAASFAAVPAAPPPPTTTTSTTTTSSSSTSTSTTTVKGSTGDEQDFLDALTLQGCRGAYEWVVAFRVERSTEPDQHPLGTAYRALSDLLATEADLDEEQLRVVGRPKCGIRDDADAVVIVGSHGSRESACEQVTGLGEPPAEAGDGWRIVRVAEIEDLGKGNEEVLGDGVEKCDSSESKD